MTVEPFHRRISVLRSETRKTGESYRKIELGAESDLESAQTWQEGYSRLLEIIEGQLQAALRDPLDITPGTPTKSPPPTATKITGSDLTNEQLSVLKWKQSQKREALSTIVVSQELLTVPIAGLLYRRLMSAPSQSWKLGEVTYKLSRTDDGTQFLQKWEAVPRS